MRIDLPLCSFKDCRYNFDRNCKDKNRKEKCEFKRYENLLELLDKTTEYFYKAMKSGCIKNDTQQFTYEDEMEVFEKIQNYETIGDWIPCKERLPEENGYYLCTIFCEDGRFLIKQLFFYHLHIWFGDCENVVYPDAWMSESYESKE